MIYLLTLVEILSNRIRLDKLFNYVLSKNSHYIPIIRMSGEYIRNITRNNSLIGKFKMALTKKLFKTTLKCGSSHIYPDKWDVSNLFFYLVNDFIIAGAC